MNLKKIFTKKDRAEALDKTDVIRSSIHKKEIYFRIADANHAMYHPNRFVSEEEARKVIEKEYTNRNKNDGHDEYWRNRKQIVIKITEEVLE